MDFPITLDDDLPAQEGDASFNLFKSLILELLPASRVITDPLLTFVHGTDASIYQLTPKMVLLVETEDEVAKICRAAWNLNVPITFRAAGTSLSGQAVTDSVLVKLGTNGWRNYELLDDGASIRLEPGLTGGQANQFLKHLSRKIGPDPASINAAMIGGIAANNSSGMCCGTAQNSYQTVRSMRLIMADGAILDTSDAKSISEFQSQNAQLIKDIERLRDDVRSNHELVAKINKKYAIKNTTGYSLNALVDFDDPIDILQHLIIGSEGTLGFISEITLQTVVDPPHKASALIFYKDIYTACQAVALLKLTSVSAVELMDYASLRSIQEKPEMRELLGDIKPQMAALLIDVRGSDRKSLNKRTSEIIEAVDEIETVRPIEFSTDFATYALYWNVRKGLFPQVGAVRENGTTVIIEDVAVETNQLAEAVTDLQALFKTHGYDNAIIFGHALEGNVHFVITQAFDTASEIARYDGFMQALTQLITKKYDGSLKAEHSTGRNMAPFVELEWGRDAYKIMRRIKTIFDPCYVLNPGVILNDNAAVHIENLKLLPSVDDGIDKCIECGFCEATCPSRAFTFTPRQRIIGLREIQRRTEAGAEAFELRHLQEEYQFSGVDSCAGDGLCSLSCPVDIDTGEMMRKIRADQSTPFGQKVADFIARRFSFVVSSARIAFSLAYLVRSLTGSKVFRSLCKIAHFGSFKLIPKWIHDLPRPLSPYTMRKCREEMGSIVFFSSCSARVLGRSQTGVEGSGLREVCERIFNAAGYNLIQPKGIENLCCGMPFESKGIFHTGDDKMNELYSSLIEASDDGRYPIVFDTSPCTLRLRRKLGDKIKCLDLVEAIEEFVIDKVPLTRLEKSVALHLTCSARRLEEEDALMRIAKTCASEVMVPEDIQCCGFAGDKGFQLPELNANALRHLEDQLPDDCIEGYSTSCTCEIGLSTHSGRPYQSIAFLVDECIKKNGS